MIKIKSILIENFRGIKRLQIDLNCISLIIQGLNGTGKSGVVDAIEFGLTGEITRLSGVGTANISLKSHAPHVDFRDMPEKAKVIIDIINQNDEIFTIERTVASPQKPSVNPNNHNAQIILSFLKEHPEFALSRKEILKFILAEPGKRAKEVQALLKMEAVEKVRASFQTLCNQMQKELNAKINEVNSSSKKFLNHLQLLELKQELVVASINKVRKSIGLDEILNISSKTKLAEGIDSKIGDTKKQISKKDVQEKINAFILKIMQQQENIKLTLNEMKLAIIEIKKSPHVLNDISKQQLYETGLDLLQEEICPLCDNEWDIEKLKNHIQNKIEKNNHAVSIKNKIVNGCDVLRTEWKIISDEIIEIKKTIISLNMIRESEDLDKLVAQIIEDIKLLDSPFSNAENILQYVDKPYSRIDDNIQYILNTVLEEVKKLPEASKEEEAKQYLIIADERLKNYQEKKREKDISSIRYNLSKNLSDIYTSISEEKLLHLYSEVEKEFSKFYGQINKEDESGFKANLTPNQGGLTFEVDFYNRGFFPPNALHSEGHQDGMGLCLYFALAKRLMGNDFTFCLLDDVLVSVDINHRREFCRFLKSEFPNTQFVITTHDEIWAKNLNTEGVVKSSKQMLHFRKWTVNDGPLVWDAKEVWDEIDSFLTNNQMTEAAHNLRRYLEYILGELAYKLRVKLEARASTSYDLGETLPAVVAQYKEYLRKAKDAASSWNQRDQVHKLEELDKVFGEIYKRTNAEQWSINPLVHYNAWANFTKNDFNPVKNEFSNLLAQLRCQSCDNWIYASPIKGSVELIRCDCGNINFNLKKKH